ncbi:MBG domain-containing protein [Mucilaginibacter celer]|nr:MBG domain-containing protein [Mucilaginibacter celer]
MKQFLPLLLFVLLPASIITAQTRQQNAGKFSLSAGLRFEENKGQVLDDKGQTRNDILYTLKDNDVTLFFTRTGITYQWRQVEGSKQAPVNNSPGKKSPLVLLKPDHEKRRVKVALRDMRWLNTGTDVTVLAEDAYSDVVNRYSASGVVENIKSYHKLIYKNLYPNTDIVYYIKDGKLEYDVVLHKGAELGNVKFTYSGKQKVKLAGGKIVLKNEVGSLTEHEPIAYSGTEALNIRYRLKDNVIGFEAVDGSSLKGSELLIDPTITWGTYLGGGNDDAGVGTATDALGNVYLAGYTSSTQNIASAGGYQSGGGDPGGFNYDAFLVKFDSNGNRLWATYYGGANSDYGSAVCTDNANNVFLVGYTRSSAGIASAESVAQGTLAGDYDAFVVKFSSTGARIWGTYFGGPVNDNGYISGDDLATCAATNADGDIFVGGYTWSKKFPIKSSTYQKDYAGGRYDAFIFGLNSGGAPKFSTYYGGKSDDIINGIAAKGTRVYICGNTNSSNKIASSGTHQGGYSGPADGTGYDDAFLTAFSTGGAFEWGTYYGGSGDEAARAVATDADGNIYVGGFTNSSSNIALNGFQNTGYSSNVLVDRDGFLAKFTNTGSLIWGTYYGGSPVDEVNAVAVDGSNNVYIGGYTKSFVAGQIAKDGFKDNISAGNDGFVAKFNAAGARLWGSYLGGSDEDIVKGLATSGNYLYIAGSTTSTSGIASGGFQYMPGGGINDGFLLKIEGSSNPPVDPVTPKNSSNIVFSNAASDKVTLTWTNGTGTARIVEARTADDVFPNPANASIYPNNNVYGLGFPIDADTRVVYRGTGNTVTVTGLTANTKYYFKVFDYTGAFEPQVVYLTENTTGNPASTTIGKTDQTITFAGPVIKTYGDADFDPAMASSGLAVTYSSSNTSVVSLIAGKLHITGTGTANITASQAGNGTYGAATPVTQQIIVNKAVLTARALDAAKTYGSVNPDLLPGIGGFVNGESTNVLISYPTLSTTATISSPVGAYPINITGGETRNYTFNYINGTLTVNKATLRVTADDKSREENTPNPALTVSYNGFVNGDLATNLTTAPTATTTATVSSPVGYYPIVPAGGVSGNYNFIYTNGRLEVFAGLPAQTIYFPPFDPHFINEANFYIEANVSSGLRLTFTSSNPAVATIVNNNQIHVVGLGSTVITASQPGNASYRPAVDVMQTLNIGKVDQVIFFSSMGKKNYGTPDFDPSITTSSGLPVVLTSDNLSVATIVSGKIHIVGVGNANITASQAGNDIFNPAVSVTRLLAVNSASQFITFNQIDPKLTTDADFDPGATASSGLTVTYASSNLAVATIVGGKVHIVGPGSTTITATQTGDSHYAASQPVSRQLLVTEVLSQTISFNAFGTKYFGDADFDANATSSAGLPVTLTSDNTDVATIIGGRIHIVNAGIANITATQPGALTVTPADPVTRTLTVKQQVQTITFVPLTTKYYSTIDFEPGATASSGLPVSYTSSNEAVATIVSGKIHIVGLGATIITAMQDGNANIAAAAQVSQNLTVIKDKQIINFPTITKRRFGLPDFSARATSNLGLPVTLVSSNEAVAKVIGGNIHIVSVGNTNITASQPGNETASAAVSVTRLFTVLKANQTITFPVIAPKATTAVDFDPLATASSGLQVTYSSKNTSIATIVNGKVHILRAGRVTITASQAGSANYAAAPNVNRSLIIRSQATQVITFPNLAVKEFGDADFLPNAMASSGLPVTYTSSNPAIATIVDGKVHIVGVGSVVIIASQPGNEAVAAAAQVSRTLRVRQGSQTITFANLAEKLATDADFDPGATASSGLPVSYTTDNAGVATIVDGKVHIVRAGIVKIIASQAGNVNFRPAATVSRRLIVNGLTQTITFNPLVGKFVNDPDFALTATSSSGLPVSYTSGNLGIAQIVEGNKVHINGAGTVTITASQPGNATIAAAVNVERTLTVSKINQTITFDDIGSVSVGMPYTLHATSTSGLPVIFITSDETTATISGTTLTGLRRGRVIITATQPGNENFLAAPRVSKEVMITQDLAIVPNNLLTPNGDGRNDLWIVENIEVYPRNTITIFDRAGRTVYHASGYRNDWDGTSAGGPLRQDAYFYVIDLGNGASPVRGSVTILR